MIHTLRHAWQSGHRRALLLLTLTLGVLAACGGGSDNANPGLAAPSSVNATVGSSSSVGLEWRKSDGAKHYEIERKVGSGNFSPLLTVPHEVGGSLWQAYTDTGLAPMSRLTYRVRAVNDTTQSAWSTSAEVETLAAATTTYRVTGDWLGASIPNLYLVTDTGVNFSAATVTVNGTALTYTDPPGAYRASALPGAGAGTVLNLSVTVPEGTITGSATIPEVPTITAPAADALLPPATALTVTWSFTGPDPDRFHLHLLGNGPLNHLVTAIPGSARSYTVPADQVVRPSSGGRAFLFLSAVNDGRSSLTGPVLDTSSLGVAATSSVLFDIGP